MSSRIVTYKCMFCDKRFNRQELVNHVEEEHEDEIPEGFTAFRLVFNYVNKKPLSYHGKCTECGKATPWDENKGRYDRQCGSKKCHDSYVKKFEKNMVRVKGVKRISSTEEGQKKMLANRKISGTYKFQDGGEKTYTGTYEQKALEFMDKVINIKSDDIMAPGPTLQYKHTDGKIHMYITDFYYQPYNLVIEVKDGGDNPNKRNMPDYRQKQIEKEQYIIKNTNYNYLRLTNNDLQQLLSTFCLLKLQMVDNSEDRVIQVNESGKVYDSIKEFMNALMTGKVVGLKDSDAYIINYLPRTTFVEDDEDPKDKYKIGLTNGSLTDIAYVDDDNLLRKGKVYEVCDLNHIEYYKADKSLSEVSSKLIPYLGKEINDSFIYEACTGKKLYTRDQISFALESVTREDERVQYLIKESLLQNTVNSKVDSIVESVNSIKEDIYNG